MNQTIRLRIEQIKRGEIPEGYEKTPFGIFPCDWENSKKFETICFINPKTEKLPDEFIYIDLESVVKGKLVTKKTISRYGAPSRAQRVLYNGDVIYQMVRPYQKNNYILNKDIADDNIYVASTGYAQLRSNCNSFIYQLINSNYFCDQVLEKCTGTNYPAINSEDLGKVMVCYPSSQKEQEKIAEILQEQDRLIDLKEKLIEEKKKQKQYLMDVLLTGKVRLPGFTDEWKKFHLRELCSIRTGRLDANAAVENGRYPFFTCSREELRINKYSFNGEAILLAGNGDVGHTKYYSGKFDAYQRTYVLMDFKINPKLIKCYIDMAVPTIVQKELQGGAMPYIKLSTLEKVSFFAPNDFNEQEAIIKDIELFAVELELLQKELEEQKRKKQSLMQLLLTGIVRVKA